MVADIKVLAGYYDTQKPLTQLYEHEGIGTADGVLEFRLSYGLHTHLIGDSDFLDLFDPDMSQRSVNEGKLGKLWGVSVTTEEVFASRVRLLLLPEMTYLVFYVPKTHPKVKIDLLNIAQQVTQP